MKPRFLTLVALLALAGCATETSSVQLALSEPVAMALVCISADSDGVTSVPVGECDPSANQQLMAYVVNGPTGDLDIVNLWTGQAVDSDIMIPGYTRLYLGTYLTDIAANPNLPTVYIADSAEPVLRSVTGVEFEADVDLPAPAEHLLVAADGTYLLATMPALSQLARVALAEDGSFGEVTLFDLPGLAYSLAAVDETQVLVGYLDRQFVSLLETDGFTVVAQLPLVPACSDGLDNDDDGLVDWNDPGCLNRQDNDEQNAPDCPPDENGEIPDECTPAELPVECADGIDNDGDGLADLLDPGCLDRADFSEGSDAPMCADGIDNDGDGKSDLDDADCLTPEQNFESAHKLLEGFKPACSDGWDNDGDGLADTDDAQCSSPNDPWEAPPYPCANNFDDDGDGLVDVDDPDCFGAGGTSESGYPSPMPDMAVSPDGKFAYVTHRGVAQVVVLDLEQGILVTVNDVTDSVDRKIRALKGKWGIEFASAPVEALFQETDDGLMAFVGEEAGLLSKVRVTREAQPLHQVEEVPLEEGDFRQSTASKPRLYVDGDEVQVGYSPPTGYPNFGPLLVQRVSADSERRVYYGITFSDDRRSQRSETWYVEYEGNLPGTADGLALVRDDRRIEFLGLDLCKLGALPGDLVCLDVPYESDCESFIAGGEYCYVSDELHSDFALLNPATGDYDGLAGIETAQALDPACFPGPVAFKIRPSKSFLVTGTRSGFLHQVISTTQGCMQHPDADPAFTGRALAAQPVGELATCPITSKEDGVELHTFQNPMFSFDIFPACDITPDGEVSLLTPARGTVWSFSVTSGFLSSVIQVASLPVDLEAVVEHARLYVLDLAGKAIKTIDLDEFSILSSFY